MNSVCTAPSYLLSNLMLLHTFVVKAVGSKHGKKLEMLFVPFVKYFCRFPPWFRVIGILKLGKLLWKSKKNILNVRFHFGSVEVSNEISLALNIIIALIHLAFVSGSRRKMRRNMLRNRLALSIIFLKGSNLRNSVSAEHFILRCSANRTKWPIEQLVKESHK